MTTFLRWHLVYWLFPMLCVGSAFVAAAMGVDPLWHWVQSPFGFIENIPSVFLWTAIIVAILMLCDKTNPELKPIRGWLIAFIIACIYFSGEDINWGQYWLDLEVPRYMLENNKEHEINLHNMNSWFNQKPRIMVEIWSLVACLLVPLGWKWPQKATAKFIPAVLWPTTRNLVAITLMAIAFEFAGDFEQTVWGMMQIKTNSIRFSELQEITYAYLMMLYAIDLRRRTRAVPEHVVT